MRFNWKVLLGLVLTVALLWWLFRNEDPVEIWNQIRAANPWLLLLSIALTTFGFVVRAMRWRIFLEPVQSDSRFSSRFAAVCIGFMTNNLTSRLGEFTRPYSYSRMEPVSMSAALATLVAERVFDGVAVLLLLFVAMLSPSFPDETLPDEVALGVRSASILLGLVLLVVLALLLLPELSLRVTRSLARRLLPQRWADKMVAVANAFIGGLGSMRSPRLLGLGLAWSLAFWIFHSFAFWVGFFAFDIHLPFTAALFMNASVAFFVAVPSSPGFFGTFHAGVKIALVTVYSVLAPQALGFAVGWHLGAFIPVTLMGLWYVQKLGLSLKDLGRTATEQPTTQGEHPTTQGEHPTTQGEHRGPAVSS